MASGSGWYIRWRQQGERVVGRSTPRWKEFTDLYCAITAADAFAQWGRASYINAEVLAMWRADIQLYVVCSEDGAAAGMWSRMHEYVPIPQNGGNEGGGAR